MAPPPGLSSQSSVVSASSSENSSPGLSPGLSKSPTSNIETPTKPSRRFIPSLRFSQLISPTLVAQFADPSNSPISQAPKSPQPQTPSKASPVKHIPIIIPDYAYPILQDEPLTPKSEQTPIISDQPITFNLTQPPPLPAASRQRHVEIKIPEWITAKYLPPTPTKSIESAQSDDSDSTYRRKAAERSPIPCLESEDDKSLLDFLGLEEQDKGGEQRKDSAVSILSMANPLRLNTRVGTLNSNAAVNPSPTVYMSNMNGLPASSSSKAGGHGGLPFRINTHDVSSDPTPIMTPASSRATPADPSPSVMPGPPANQSTSSNLGLSGFVCNVHRTTGKEPKPLVGATTTIVGDKLYVFGGRKLSRSRSQLTSDLYELDLIKRHWTKIECKGDIPPPRYFHSVCPLGDTKLVLYGGMTPSPSQNGKPNPQSQPVNSQDPHFEMAVLSDIHIYDIPTQSWMKVIARNSPQGRYAHCATVLPSSAVFASAKATYSAIQHNPSSPDAPNSGRLGVQLDGSGGAEMVVVGGQDAANHYIEQISVFNLRSLSWTSTSQLGRACGAYRSVTAPLPASVASKIGIGPAADSHANQNDRDNPPDGGAAMLIYSNYNFLDVRLELQIHLSDGSLVEKPMPVGEASPPGLRFPNGGVIDNHFVVSGTFLTSYKQEYALWALDLQSLTWNRIDIGSTTFSQGSWNRGMLWSRRNAFVIMGNRKRSLVEDYNHRRVNFSNMCVVELEAFGLYNNPRRLSPMSGFISASSATHPALAGLPSVNPEAGANASSASRLDRSYDNFAGGRELSRSAEELGRGAQMAAELSDMEILAINGERIPANSRLISRRWGPYFNKLMREAVLAAQGDDTATLRPSLSNTIQSSRNSSITITPSISSAAAGRDSTATTVVSVRRGSADSPGPEATINAAFRPRTLFLPHTPQTIQALLHFLYTSSLPPPSSALCNPQILCSLLQIARPYKIDGLLEAVVEQLHGILDPRNTAAVFNAAAMAAGGGVAVEFTEDDGEAEKSKNRVLAARALQRSEPPVMGTDSDGQGQDEIARPGTASSQSGTDTASEDDAPTSSTARKDEAWTGSLSSVVGLQKRGLRGLMEGRRVREMGSRDTGGSGGSGDRVGLGIERA
jgi:hypothetical protein